MGNAFPSRDRLGSRLAQLAKKLISDPSPASIEAVAQELNRLAAG